MLGKIMSAFWPAPIPLSRETPPPISAKDRALAEEEANVSPDDIEAALQAIRAHARGRTAPRTGPDPVLAQIALAQAEKFANECLDFDRVITRASRIDRAFTIWSRSQRFSAVAESDFARALEVILAWQGGHRAIKAGQPVYVGCALRREVADSLGKAVKPSVDHRPGAGVVIDQSPTE